MGRMFILAKDSFFSRFMFPMIDVEEQRVQKITKKRKENGKKIKASSLVLFFYI
jgi:hypothetical protein